MNGKQSQMKHCEKDAKEVTKKKLWREKKLYWFKKQFR